LKQTIEFLSIIFDLTKRWGNIKKIRAKLLLLDHYPLFSHVSLSTRIRAILELFLGTQATATIFLNDVQRIIHKSQLFLGILLKI